MKELFDIFNQSVLQDNFVKLTISKPIKKGNILQNVYIRTIVLKNETLFQFLYRNKTNDFVKNYTKDLAVIEIEKLITENFRAVTLFTLFNDWHMLISKKGKITLKKTSPTFKNKLPQTHNKFKKKQTEKASYLYYLGIIDNKGNVIPKMADKYRQINKYLEIIEAQLQLVKLSKEIKIVDMGSGKGYLTFALYNYLAHQKKYNVHLTGIELREDLVNKCNEIAKKCGFKNLHFLTQRIEDYQTKKIDVLIALHACDTATDDAIYKGLSANAQLIICAPCCHKQLRKQVKGKKQENPLLKHGIFKERQLEMVTDTIRALILEKNNYNTKVFEFISNAHTRKNVMLVGTKSSKKRNLEQISTKINVLKNEFHIENHYLETLF